MQNKFKLEVSLKTLPLPQQMDSFSSVLDLTALENSHKIIEFLETRSPVFMQGYFDTELATQIVWIIIGSQG